MKKMIYSCILGLSSLFLLGQPSTVVYKIKGADTLKMDIYSPTEVMNSKMPVLLWMHGGGFAGGSRDAKDEVKLCEFAKDQGYVGVSISYRLTRKGNDNGFGCKCPSGEKLDTFKQAVVDYMDAADYLSSHAEVYNIDKDKIIAGGSSAGAEAVLNAVYMREYFVDDLKTYKDVKFAAVLSLAGALVNSNYITSFNALPTVLYHGTKDHLVPFGSNPHHYCKPNDVGYLMLDGSLSIASRLENLRTSFLFNMVEGGRHELSEIPHHDLTSIFNFFESTINSNIIQQTKIIKTKAP